MRLVPGTLVSTREGYISRHQNRYGLACLKCSRLANLPARRYSLASSRPRSLSHLFLFMGLS